MVQSSDSQQRFVTLTQVTVDMANHVDARSRPLTLALPLPNDGRAALQLVISAAPVKVRCPCPALRWMRATLQFVFWSESYALSFMLRHGCCAGFGGR